MCFLRQLAPSPCNPELDKQLKKGHMHLVHIWFEMHKSKDYLVQHKGLGSVLGTLSNLNETALKSQSMESRSKGNTAVVPLCLSKSCLNQHRES